MKKIISAFLLLFAQAVSAQQFDVFTYTEPAGWKKEMISDHPVYSITNEQTGTYAMIVLFPAVKSNGSLETDFASAWRDEAIRPYSVTNIPNTQEAAAQGKWKIITGAAAFKQNGKDAIAMLTVFTGYNKTANVLMLMSDGSYQTVLTDFLGSLKLSNPAGVKPAKNPVTQPGNQNNPPANTNTNNNNSNTNNAALSLTGEWSNNSMTSADFVNASGGYTGDATIASTSIFIFKPDGSYEERFNIYLNSKFHFFTYKGKFARSGNTLTLYPAFYEHKVNAQPVPNNNLNNMQIVSYTYVLSMDPDKNRPALQLTCAGENCVNPDKLYRVK